MKINFLHRLFGERGLIFSDIFTFMRKILKYNASLSTMNDVEKAQYTLLRRTHIIEKGMSFRQPKIGFGQAKVLNLIQDLILYTEKYGSSSFLNYPVSAISKYILYTKDSGVSINEIEQRFNSLINKMGSFVLSKENAGIKILDKDYILNHNKDFKELLVNRHSIRFFSKQEVNRDIIEQALQLAQNTPSACNRQGWKTHVYCGLDSVNLVKWQGGAKGFEEEIRYAILVTANLKAFLSHEIHQAYVDGGLYAMNLINVLTYLGLGTIPLSCGFHETQLSHLEKFKVPCNEIPIMIIGFGWMEDKLKVAISKRKSINETNTFH